MTIKRKIILLCGALLVADATAEETFTTIFDGKTLEGWHIMQKPTDDNYYSTDENFFVKDGAIHCYQLPNLKGGLLLSDTAYADFELELEIKSDWGCDSGIFLRCTEGGQGIQILNDYLEEGCIGFLFGQGTGAYLSRPVRLYEVDGTITAKEAYNGIEKDGLVYAISADKWNKVWKAGEWNTLKVRCVGAEPLITTWVNGVKVMEMDGTTYKARVLQDEIEGNWEAPTAWDRERVQNITGGRGSVALQIHPGTRWKPGGAAMYRNIRIKELKLGDGI